MEKKRLGKNIIGTWKLVSWVFEDENGNQVNYFGDNPKGQLVFMDSGQMCVQVSKGDRPKFEKEGLDEGSLEEKADAFGSYIAYYGKYEEIEPGVLRHDVIGSLFPNWVDGFETRFADLEGDDLTLSTDIIHTKTGGIIFKISWRRI